MPDFRIHSILEIARNVKAYLKVEAGITRGGVPSLENGADPLSEQLAARDREIARLRARLAGENVPVGGVRPENVIWMFGVARTGSSWLGAMMGDLDGHAVWYEPYVGDVFGYAYFMRAGEAQRGRPDFVLGDPHRETWTRSIRAFFLEGANARFPETGGDGYLVVKEPNGSVGAPLLVEALPESRVILLVRDPRDVVSSLLAASKKGSWGAEGSGSLADDDPDEFVRQRAKMYVASLGKARDAYRTHEGPKVVVRYEDLRYDAPAELERIYAALGVPVGVGQLWRVAEKHAWENVPEGRKGETKPRRKARPGGWREDLTPGQAGIVEGITASFIEEFYPEENRPSPGPSD